MRKIILAVIILLASYQYCFAERFIDTLIIHHTASADVSAKIIDQWHKQRGWEGIGYHYVIRADGTVETGRPVSKVGAHAKTKGRNIGSIGIALTGNQTFTLAQKIALAQLTRNLLKRYNITKIQRHHNACPGPSLNVEGMARELLSEPRIESKTGYATYFNDWKTASGQHIYPWTIGVASWDYPLNSKVMIYNKRTKKSIIAKVIDRGPNKKLYIKENKILDLTTATFNLLADRTDWQAGKMAISVKEVR
jgi:N-acetylmuramoyl-L-alanine amidase